MQRRLLHQFLEESARRFPDKIAVKNNRKLSSYQQIDKMANQVAHQLLCLGLQRGERVCIFLDQSIDIVIAIYGILRAGGAFSVLSTTLKSKKLDYILRSSDAVFLISEGSKYGIIQQALQENTCLKHLIMCHYDDETSTGNNSDITRWEEIFVSQPISNPQVRSIDIDLASIIYTSGSTGEPKGVALTHRNIVAASVSIITYLEYTEDDIILDVLPLSFDYGLYQVFMAFMVGATIVLEASPFATIKKLITEKVTVFPIIPTLLSILLKLQEPAKFDFSHLRCITNTGAALPVEYIKAFRAKFPHVKVYSMYGLTECKRVAYLPPEEIERKPLSVGKAMPNVETFIVDERGDEVGSNVVGELVVRGSNVTDIGYWKDPEATNRLLKPGKYPGEKILYTGDFFKMDDEGFLYFVSRKDDLIKTRGERVSPREIEDALYAIDGVAEAAVIGVQDEFLGTAIKGFVVLEHGAALTQKAIIHHCSEQLEYFMVPRSVEFMESFKKTSTGKIDKKALS